MTKPSGLPDGVNGVVFGSVGVVNALGYGIKALYRRSGSSEYGVLVFDYTDAKDADFISGLRTSNLVVASLPEGSYEFYDVEMQIKDYDLRGLSGTVKTTTFRAREIIPITFIVSAAHPVYLGNLLAMAVCAEGDCRFHPRESGGGTAEGHIIGGMFYVHDELARDFRAMTSRNSAPIQLDSVVSMIDAFRNRRHPLFVVVE